MSIDNTRPPATQADALVEELAETMFYHGGKYADIDWLDPENAARREAYLEEARAILPIIQRETAAAHAVGRAENYKTFTDGMEAAAQICGSLAETTYDDADAFEAATGCEAAIMRVVKDQRKEQANAIERGQDGSKGEPLPHPEQPFPPPYCVAMEDCAHDGVCHDPVDCGAEGPSDPEPYPADAMLAASKEPKP